MIHVDAKIQASPALISVPGKTPPGVSGYVGVYDFLTKSFAYLPQEAFYWFEYFQSARSWLQVVRDHKDHEIDDLKTELEQLLEPGFLAIVGTQLFDTHREYRDSWKWDISSAMFHFTATDNEFLSEEDAQARTAERAKSIPQPAKSWKHGKGGTPLPSPMSGASKSLFETLAKRRTVRISGGHTLCQSEIGDCLFAGLGITGYVETASGQLPLKMTPSGGARNPFEAYVVLNRGKDLEPGVYHYSAAEHSLNLLQANVPAGFAPFLAKQKWTEGMAGYIFLVAVMERTMWKYQDPNAYRVILIEAGHIAQNIMVAAANLGLCVCPTAALAHRDLSKLLNLDSLTHVPVYALTLDKAGTSTDVLLQNVDLAS